MMLKRWTRLLALCVCLCLMGNAAFAAQVLPTPPEDAYRQIRALITAGDAAYVMTTQGDRAQLWRWKEGMAQAELIQDDMRYADFANADMPDELVLTTIFSDGEELYGFNQLDGSVFLIKETDAGVQFTDVVTLQDNPLMYYEGGRALKSRREALVLGEKLLWHLSDSTLLVYDLTTGFAKSCAMSNIRRICAYRDGKALLLIGTSGGYICYSYDPVTDEIIRLTDVIQCKDRAIAYEPARDRMLYRDASSIMALQMDGTAVQVGFISQTTEGSMALLGDTLLCVAASEVHTCPVQETFTSENSVTILASRDSRMDEWFPTEYPGVPYYFISSVEESAAELLAKETGAPDVMALSPDEFVTLRDSGALLDLSAYPALMDYAQKLYPPFAERMTKDGGVYGVLTRVNSYDGWYINRKVMEDMGLTVADIPTSLTELCAFATRWNEEFVDKYPQYTLLDGTNEYRRRILGAMVDMWQKNCQYADAPLRFDDPAFQEALAALDAMEVEALNANQNVVYPEVSEYKQPLIRTGGVLVGNWGNYMMRQGESIFLPMTLTPDTPFVTSVSQMRTWAINANTQNAEYAVAVLMHNLPDGYDGYTLLSDQVAPVESEGWAVNLAEWQREIEALQAARKDSVNPETVDAMIAALQAKIDGEYGRYVISSKDIETYRQVIMPGIFIRQADVTQTQNERFREAMTEYASGTISQENFILRMNAVVQEP